MKKTFLLIFIITIANGTLPPQVRSFGNLDTGFYSTSNNLQSSIQSRLSRMSERSPSSQESILVTGSRRGTYQLPEAESPHFNPFNGRSLPKDLPDGSVYPRRLAEFHPSNPSMVPNRDCQLQSPESSLVIGHSGSMVGFLFYNLF